MAGELDQYGGVDQYVAEMTGMGGRPVKPPHFGGKGGLRRMLGLYSPREQAAMASYLQQVEYNQTAAKKMAAMRAEREQRQSVKDAEHEFDRQHRMEKEQLQAQKELLNAQAKVQAAEKDQFRIWKEWKTLGAEPLKASTKEPQLKEKMATAQAKYQDAVDTAEQLQAKMRELPSFGMLTDDQKKLQQKEQKALEKAWGEQSKAQREMTTTKQLTADTQAQQQQAAQEQRRTQLLNLDKQFQAQTPRLQEAQAGVQHAQALTPAPAPQQPATPGAQTAPPAPGAPTSAPQGLQGLLAGAKLNLTPDKMQVSMPTQSIMGALPMLSKLGGSMGKGGGGSRAMMQGGGGGGGMPATLQPMGGGGPVPITNSMYDPKTGAFTGQTGIDWWRQHQGQQAQQAQQAQPVMAAPAAQSAQGAPMPPPRPAGIGGPPQQPQFPMQQAAPGPPPIGQIGQQPGPGAYGASIANIESGGRYGQLGPVTKTGDRAYGKYQVMGANVPSWTKEALGQPMTPQAFLQNPGAQDAVFNAKFGSYVQKYGPEGAAQAWFGGPGAVGHPERKDQLGTSVGAYGQRFMKGVGQPAGAPGASGAPQPGPPISAGATPAAPTRSKPDQPAKKEEKQAKGGGGGGGGAPPVPDIKPLELPPMQMPQPPQPIVNQPAEVSKLMKMSKDELGQAQKLMKNGASRNQIGEYLKSKGYSDEGLE